MFSEFAELSRSLFVGVSQILHGCIDTCFHLFLLCPIITMG
jgi:hypothetical protein